MNNPIYRIRCLLKVEQNVSVHVKKLLASPLKRKATDIQKLVIQRRSDLVRSAPSRRDIAFKFGRKYTFVEQKQILNLEKVKEAPVRKSEIYRRISKLEQTNNLYYLFKVNNKRDSDNKVQELIPLEQRKSNKSEMKNQQRSKLVENKWFERFIILIIFCSSLSMALYDYQDQINKTQRNIIINEISLFFTVVFVIEAIFKIISMGLIIHRDSYLRDPWNWIDFIAVCIGIIEFIPSLPNLKVLRTLRIIRPLRSIKALPSMRRIIISLLNSLPALGNVVVFLLFVFVLFGIMGMILFQGKSYQVCRTTEFPDSNGYWPINQDFGNLCKYDHDCPKDNYCRTPGDGNLTLNEDIELQNYELIAYGIVNFDNILQATLLIFQVITQVNWINLLYLYQDSTDPYSSSFYFCILVIFGSFFLLNLILAVIMNEFSHVDTQLQDEAKKADKKIEKSHPTDITNINNNNSIRPSQNKIETLSDKSKDLSQSGASSSIRQSSQILQAQQVFPIGIKNTSQSKPTRKLSSIKSSEIEQSSESYSYSKRFSKDNTKNKKEQQTLKLTFYPNQIRESMVSDSILNEHDHEKKSISSDDDDESESGQEYPQELKVSHVLSKHSKQSNQSRFKGEENLKISIERVFSHINNNGSSNQQNIETQSINLIREGSYPYDEPKSPYSKFYGSYLKPELKVQQNESYSNVALDNLTSHSQLYTQIDIMPTLESIETPKKYSDNKLTKKLQSLLSKSFLADYPLSDDGIHYSKQKNLLVQDYTSSSSNEYDEDFPLRDEREDEKLLLQKEKEQSKEKEGIHDVVVDDIDSQELDDHSEKLDTEEFPPRLPLDLSDEKQKKDVDPLKDSLGNDEIKNRARSNKILRFFYLVSVNDAFGIIIFILILVNTIILALDRYPINNSQFKKNEVANNVLSFFFLTEMIIKLIGLGIKGYAKDRYNQFDFVIVIFSVIEIILNFAEVGKGVISNGAISAFRAIRLLRIFKLARSWKSFQEILIKIGRTAKDISNFSILLFLFIFTYTILGMDLYANKVKFDENGRYDLNGVSPRRNFDNFANSFSTIFQVLIVDGWADIMYQHVRATGYSSVIFFVALVIFGHMILLNLFLAILLKNFEDYNMDKDPEEFLLPQISKKISMAFKKLFTSNSMQMSKSSMSMGTVQNNTPTKFLNNNIVDKSLLMMKPNKESVFFQSIGSADTVKRDSQVEEAKTMFHLEENGTKVVPMEDGSSRQELLNENSKTSQIKENSPAMSSITANQIRTKRRRTLYKSQFGHSNSIYRLQSRLLRQWVNPYTLNGKSLLFLTQGNAFRRLCADVVHHKFFDPFIFFLIFTSTICLTLDNPLLDPDSVLNKSLDIVDTVLTSFFILESILKIITFGFVLNGQTSYMRNAWNVTDLAIVSFAIAVLSLINSIKGIGQVFIITLMFFTLFGIFGINYFKGTFYYCYQDHLEYENPPIIEHKWDCLNVGGEWFNSKSNFDNIFQAMQTLFELATTSGWSDIMFQGIDSVKIDYQPIQDNKKAWMIFFIAFILFGSLFIMNLFVGVVINTFNEEKEKLGKNHLLTENQREWVMVQILCMKTQPLKKRENKYSNKVRNFIAIIANSIQFEIFILICIVLNTICLAIDWYDRPVQVGKIMEIINYIFAGVFILEAVLKIISFGKGYFFDGWNWFDFIIVVGTLISVFFTAFTDYNSGPGTTLIRSFRIGRVFRLVQKFGYLKRIFNTLILTIPSLANVGGLLFLLIYVYSVLGMYLFSKVKYNDALSENSNFQTFGRAFITMIRISTGDGWNDMMRAIGQQKSIIFDCVQDPSYEDYEANNKVPNGCGSTSLSILFFDSFTLVVSMIFLNLFIAIILESFENVNKEEDLKIKDSDLKVFQQQWVEYDPDGTGFISIYSFEKFLIKLIEKNSNLIRGGKYLQNDSELRRDFIAELELPTYLKLTKYHYQDVLGNLTKACYQIDLENKIKADYRGNIQNSSESLDDDSSVNYNASEHVQLFHQEISQIDAIHESVKIQLVEVFMKYKLKIADKKEKKLDKFEGNIYNSRFVYLLPLLVARMKFFIARRRKAKEQLQSEQQPNLNNEDVIYKYKVEEIEEDADAIELKEYSAQDMDNQQVLTEIPELTESPEKDQVKQESPGSTTLQEAKLKLKEGRERRKDYFNRHQNTMMSTKETDLNLLKSQHPTMPRQSVTASVHQTELDSQRKSQVNEYDISKGYTDIPPVIPEQFEKSWYPRSRATQQRNNNYISSIISENKYEESSSTPRYKQKSSVEDLSPRNLSSQNHNDSFYKRAINRNHFPSHGTTQSRVNQGDSENNLAVGLRNIWNSASQKKSSGSSSNQNKLDKEEEIQKQNVSFGVASRHSSDASGHLVFNLKDEITAHDKIHEVADFLSNRADSNNKIEMVVQDLDNTGKSDSPDSPTFAPYIPSGWNQKVSDSKAKKETNDLFKQDNELFGNLRFY